MNIIEDIDTASCAEIKEMILNETIELNSLSTEVLQRLMDYETDMLLFDEGDVGLIEKCAEVISDRETSLLSHEEFMAIVHSKLNSVSLAPQKPAKKRLRWKKLIIVAAAVSLLIATLLSIASMWGFSLSAFVQDFMKRAIYGSTADFDSITVEHGGVAVEYATVEEALSAAKRDALYPTAFPEGITVEKISVSYNNGTAVAFNIITNDEDCAYLVEFSDSKNYLGVGEFSVYKVGDLEFNVYSFADKGWCQASLYYGGGTYNVTARTYDDLILILNNIKE